MRHVPIAEFADKVSEFVCAANTGEEIMITRHGKPMAKLVAASEDRLKRQREAGRALYELGLEIRRRNGPTPIEQIVEWIDEDRR